MTISWTSPVIGFSASYVIEASSTPGGPPNLANFNTGNASTTLAVPGVPTGIYYLRVRAVDASGVSTPSNEVQVVVTVVSGESCPSAPRALSVVSQNGGTIAVGWQPPLTGVATSYVIQAGSSPGGANLVPNLDTGGTALTFTTSNVPAGSYFIRVYGKNSSCTAPTFLGPASNELVVTVNGPPPGSVTGTWVGLVSNGDGIITADTRCGVERQDVQLNLLQAGSTVTGTATARAVDGGCIPPGQVGTIAVNATLGSGGTFTMTLAVTPNIAINLTGTVVATRMTGTANNLPISTTTFSANRQ